MNLMFVNKNINKIEDQIWQNFKYDDRIGFLSGLSGIAFFYDTLFDIYKKPEYATMIERHEHENKREIIYAEYLFNFSDLKKVNRKRRCIGLNSLPQNVKNEDK